MVSEEGPTQASQSPEPCTLSVLRYFNAIEVEIEHEIIIHLKS